LKLFSVSIATETSKPRKYW